MNVERHLRELYNELRRLDRTIARLEAHMAAPAIKTRKRRGRKNMSEDERLAVSRRMTAYWASRRAKVERKDLQLDDAPATPESATQ